MAIGRLSLDMAGRADAVHLTAHIARNTLGEGVVAQTQEVLALIEADLREAGVDHADIALVTIWLRDLSEFSQMDGVWSNWIADVLLTRRLILEDRDLPDLCTIRIGVSLFAR